MSVDLTTVRRALDNNELEPCFQPIVELHSGKLSGFEVLARWRHPELGWILPDNFITLAEEDGLIGKLMRQILPKAFQSAPAMPAPLMLSVNVSPSQLRDMTLPGQIREAAAASTFPLNRLIIEITESGLIDNLEMAGWIAREIKTMGCGLALDDFGTGFSSLLHLQTLPFDELKIDRSFVSSMTGAKESRKIVAAIIGLGHSLGLTTVAEGVETEEQAQMLLRLGCQCAQGWLYGHPETADRIPQMVAAVPHATPREPTLRRTTDSSISNLEALPAQRLSQLQAIYDGAPVGLCFLDRDRRYVSINRRLADINGASVDDHLGRTPAEIVPLLYPRVEPYVLRALQGEAIKEVEVSRPAGTPGEPDAAMICSYQPAFDEEGEVIGVLVAVTDISERKRVEEALRESEEHLRCMVELNPEIPWVMDSDGNNLDVSSRWEQVTGLTKEKTRNLGWLEAVHPDDVESTMKALLEGLKSGARIDIEYRVKSLDRGWRWMRSRGSPRVGPTGEIVRWYGSVEDIDDRKKLENLLHTS
jgi:PAS domain S-box-containing protein